MGNLTARIKVVATEHTGPAMQAVMRNVRRTAAETTASARVIERSTGHIHNSLNRLGRFVGQQLTGIVRSFFYGLRMGIVGAGVAVAAFVITSVKSFRDFDKKLRETTALIAGANGPKTVAGAFKEAQKSYKDFYSYLLKTAPQMRRTPQEMAGGLYELVQAGLSGKQAKRLLRPAAMGATAGGGTVQESSRVLVQIMNALKMGTTKKNAGKTAQNVMDQIFQAINLGVGVEFPGMAQSIGKFIGSAGVTFKGGAKGGQKSLKELMATYIFSTQQGARTQDVGVGIQDVIKTIANPSVKSAKFAKSIGLGNLGSTFLRKNGFVGGLEIIIQKMKDAGYTGAKLTDAIGHLFADVRGRRIVNYAANIEKVTQALKGMGLASGATKRSFDEQGRSFDAQIQTFKSYWETTKIALGGAAMPTIVQGMGSITHALGTAGAIGHGQDLVQGAEGLRGGARKRYFQQMGSAGRLQYAQAQKFNQAGLAGKLKELGQTALNSFTAWWGTPATQNKFNAAVQGMLQRSFDMAGRLIRTMPSIYVFGRKIAGEILRGLTDGIKNSAGNMLSSLTGGLFGGSGHGGSSPIQGPSNIFQGVSGAVAGMAAMRMTRGLGPLGAGAGLAAGGLMGGLPPMLAAVLGVGRAGMVLRGSGGVKDVLGGLTGSNAKDMRGTISMSANTVYLNSKNIQGGGGPGGGKGGKGGVVVVPGGGGGGGVNMTPHAPLQGPAGLNPGYSTIPTYRMNNRFISPNNAFIQPGWVQNSKGQWKQDGYRRSAAQAAAGAYGPAGPGAVLRPGVTTGFGGFQGPGGRASPSMALGGPNPVLGPMTEAEYRAQANRWQRLTLSVKQYRAQIAPITGPVGKFGKNPYFRGGLKGGAAAAAGVAAYASADPGLSTKQKLAIGGLQGLGAASFFLGPEVGIPVMLGTSIASSMIGGGGSKKPNASSIASQLLRTSTINSSTNNVTASQGSQPGYAGGFGKGFNLKGLNKANPFKWSGRDYDQANMFSTALLKMMNVKWAPNDKGTAAFSSAMEQAMFYAGSNQIAVDTVNELADKWNQFNITKAAEYAVKNARNLAAKNSGKDGKEKKRAKKYANMMPTFSNIHGHDPGGRFDPFGGTDRGMPKDYKKRNRNFENSVAQQFINRDLWTQISTETDKKAKYVGERGPKQFAIAFTGETKNVPAAIKPSIVTMLNDITGAVTNIIGGGSGVTSGPDSGAPPGGGGGASGVMPPGSTPSPRNATRNISAAGVNGDGMDGISPIMDSAGSKMARKMGLHAAEAITKKQLAGPMGHAYKALSWLYRQVGKPYIWGGGHPPNPNLPGYDCSGLASSALQVAGSNLSGTTFSMISNTTPGAGLIKLGFNRPQNPSHMGINVLGKWFEAAHTGAPIRGPGDARSSWAYTGVPKLHSGGVYDSHTTRGEGPAILKDGEMVVRTDGSGGLKAHPVSPGGGFYINGPLIGHAEIRSAHDVHHLAQELVDLLEKKRGNSGTAGANG